MAMMYETMTHNVTWIVAPVFSGRGRGTVCLRVVILSHVSSGSLGTVLVWSDLQYAEKAPDEAAAVLRISDQGFDSEACYD